MTVYVDDLASHPSGRWCHMAVDGDPEELYAFAARLGLRRSWFQRHRLVDHYDLRPSKRARAVELGAVAVRPAELLRRCKKAPQPAAARGR